MIELKHGGIYESTSGRVEYDGIDCFCGEQTFRFKRLERIGTDYVLPCEIEKFLYIYSKEKTYDELVAMNKELLAVVNNFHITEPDEDGCVWLVLNGNGTTGMAMFNLGNGDRIAAKVALHLESDRKAAISKAKAGAA